MVKRVCLMEKLVAAVVLSLMFLQLASGAGIGDDFDYSKGPKGPAGWGDLKKEWSICKAGKSQSPINVRLDDLQPVCASRLLKASYNASRAQLISTNHDIELKFPENAGVLTIDGTVYELSEYHIHAPSEHSFNGRKYPVEGHLVHKSGDGRIAVVSVLYNVGGKDDAFIDQVEHLLPELRNDEARHVDLVDPSKINVQGKRFYRYRGSLTTPPCTEGITWNILRHPRNLSKKQYNLLLKTLKGANDRPVQSDNGRMVSYFK